MTREQEQQAAELFQAVFELPAPEREPALAAADPAIAARVRALLAALGDQEPEREPEPWPPARIGPYLLGERIGEGGFGVVYRATREIGGARTPVAIKFLEARLANEEMRARFDLERRILSELDHPGIARLLDGGATPDGSAYLVMEFVEGLPLDRFSDERRLGIAARLGLFLQVCEAVAHAHRHQLLHRDLKPANILVDQSGTVKLLDFGIARLAAPGAAEMTGSGQKRFTLSHASPEQLRGEPLTVGADIYALGVILYQLLCGQLPFPPQARWDLEAARSSREREPVPPAALEGDLGAVLRKALRTAPEERYGSADALRFDLERYLGGWPVEARTPGLPRRVRKWIRRNPATAAMLALTAALFGWGVRAATLPYVRSAELQRRERRLMALTRDILYRDLALVSGNLEAEPRVLEALAGEQRRFLEAVGTLPLGMRIRLERERLSGYAEVAESWWKLGRRREAESAMSVAVEGFGALLGQTPAEPALGRLYRAALEARYRYRSEAGMAREAQEDRARILEYDGGSHGARP